MPTNTPLQSIVLTSSATSITFSGINQSYTDLILVMQPAADVGDENVGIRFNGDTGTTYSYTRMGANNTVGSQTSSRQSSFSRINTTDAIGTSPTLGNLRIVAHINDYSNSTTYKTLISRSGQVGGTYNGVEAFVGLWQNISAITSLTVMQGGARTFLAGSTFDLYGISPVNAAISSASGGTDIFYDSTYAYHVFKGSGTFTPNRNLTVDYLVVAGGGGGGNHSTNTTSLGAGGGGAGGLRSTVTATGGGGTLETALSLTAGTKYTVTVGAGGASVAASQGSSGSNSVFSTITSTGGGGGGCRYTFAGTGAALSGGSGGGSAISGAIGTGTANQGFNGAIGSNGGGGGGGAGGAGVANSVANGGAGGAGVATTISGSSVTYAGGGAGGASATASAVGGSASGGGGAGANANTGNTNGTAGTTNTGGGGGGSTGTDFAAGTVGGPGGSGIVIVRYAR